MFVISGEATLLVGGKIVERKTTSPGEVRGSALYAVPARWNADRGDPTMTVRPLAISQASKAIRVIPDSDNGTSAKRNILVYTNPALELLHVFRGLT